MNMKKAFATLAAAFCLTAVLAQAETNVTFKAYTLQDQHGTAHSLDAETRLVIMAFEMPHSKAIHEWLSGKEADYLKTHQAEYVVDISPMPGIITWLFAGPKMKKYDFPIIQAKDDDFAADYPSQLGKITVLKLDATQENAVAIFVETVEEVEAILDPESEAAKAIEAAAEAAAE